jgi:phosphate transport system protein
MAHEIRKRYHEDLKDVELAVQAMAAAAEKMVETAAQVLTSADLAQADELIADDDEVDSFHLVIERRILGLFAMQTPVASDLRLLTALLHIIFHLERVGDMAVNIAKLTKLTQGLPRSGAVLQYLNEMVEIAVGMLRTAMDALARRDVDLCRRLPEMDEPIDRLNRGMLNRILELSDDKELLEWGIRMHVVSRQLERIGDHAVDIGEQVAFLVTGEFREFTDASHPEVERREVTSD